MDGALQQEGGVMKGKGSIKIQAREENGNFDIICTCVLLEKVARVYLIFRGPMMKSQVTLNIDLLCPLLFLVFTNNKKREELGGDRAGQRKKFLALFRSSRNLPGQTGTGGESWKLEG